MQTIGSRQARVIRQLLGVVSAGQWVDWRWQWQHRITTLAQLQPVLHLSAGRRRDYQTVLRRYPLSVTPYYLALIDFSDPRDPLRRQCLPDLRELAAAGCADPDPLGECPAMKMPGFIQRYPDRAVVLATGACAVYCRHCTRKNLLRRVDRHYVRRYLRSLVAAVACAKSVREVIVSGGDPLLLDPDVLDDFLGALRALRHVEVLRLGTRLPVVLPMRITSRLCAGLARHRPLWINTQFNHPREITPEAIRACDLLQQAGLPVSNQTVLLRGINDRFSVLADLCNGLQRIMVRPYYIFQCDPVRGVSHFRTPLAQALRLAGQLHGRLGGLSTPQVVVDVPGRTGKLPLQRSPVVALMKNGAILRDYRGRRVHYPA